MKAGSVNWLQSVRPNHEFDIQEIDDDDEVDDSGMEGERISLEEEDEVVKKMKDPKLPTQEEVDKHYVMGAYTLQGLVSCVY